MEGKKVIIATICAPTTEGGRFKLVTVFDDNMTVKDAMDWAESKTGSAILDCVEITQPDSGPINDKG
jgi:hypothetical protein